MKNRDFDPEKYTISIQKIVEYGESLFVAKVAELPDLAEYGDSFEFVRELAINAIEASYELCSEQGIPFPSPIKDSDLQDVSGRVTLRLPKNVHRQSIKLAEENGVSLNSYLLSCISSHNATASLHTQIEKLNQMLSENTYSKPHSSSRKNYFLSTDVAHLMTRGRRMSVATFNNRDENEEVEEEIRGLTKIMHFTQGVVR